MGNNGRGAKDGQNEESGSLAELLRDRSGGWVQGGENTQAAAINAFPHIAESASGMTGFLQMFFAAFATQLVALLYDGTPFPMIYLMMTASVLSMISFSVAMRWGRQ